MNDDVVRGELARLQVPMQGTEEPVGLLVRRDQSPPAHVREFMAVLRSVGSEN